MLYQLNSVLPQLLLQKMLELHRPRLKKLKPVLQVMDHTIVETPTRQLTNWIVLLLQLLFAMAETRESVN
jgi:hypothetical protein